MGGMLVDGAMIGALPATVPRPRATRWGAVAWPAAYLPLAVALTWPLAGHFATRLGGDFGDHWQNLWNVVWTWRSLWHGRSPFFTDRLWHPDGTTLVFQTFDLPDLVWAAPIVPLAGPVGAFNAVVLWTFVGSGLAMYALGRGTGASRPAAFLSGCAFTFATYHFGHARGHLHIQAMQWVPLFALALWKALEGRQWKWAVFAGVFGALAGLASWYHLFAALLLGVVFAAARIAADRGRSMPQALVAAGVGAALLAPLAAAIQRERASEAISGAHDARFYSADLQSFFLPNSPQWLARFSGAHALWTGNGAELSCYFGCLLLALGVAGAVLGAPRTRAYLAVALVGAVLSLGPALHVGGRIVTGDVLPYEWLRRAVPLLDFTGVPVRLAFTATFGLAAALAPTLDALAARVKRPWARAVPFAIGAAAILEHAPNGFATSQFPVPAPMLEWAKDPADFAVLDACRDMRHLWHQAVHGHPIFGGYLTRTPARLEKKLADDPVAGPLWAWEAGDVVEPFSADALDFDFAQGVAPGAEPTSFSLDLTGVLEVPRDGEWRFSTVSDDDSELFVDGRLVVDNRGEHPARERSGTVELTAGAHRIRVAYRQRGGGALLRAFWEGPGAEKRTIRAPELRELQGQARFRRRGFAVGANEALKRLRELKVRYVVQDAGDSAWPMEGQLGLGPIWNGDGVRIYRVAE